MRTVRLEDIECPLIEGSPKLTIIGTALTNDLPNWHGRWGFGLDAPSANRLESPISARIVRGGKPWSDPPTLVQRWAENRAAEALLDDQEARDREAWK